MHYIEVTTEEAIEILKKSKGDKVKIAVSDLSVEGTQSSLFYPVVKSECEVLIKEAETIASACDDLVKQLKLYSVKQVDINNISSHGKLNTVLLRG